MRFSPLFIGVVTVYWGFSTGFEYLAIIMAALFELSRVLKIKFDLLKDKTLVKTVDYDKKVLVRENNPYEFVKSVNKSFEEIIEELIKEINNSY